LEQPRKRREWFSPGQDLKEERVGQSAIARLVTSKPYQYKQVCGRMDQQEWDRKRPDTALMREDTTHDMSPPATEDKVKKKKHIQEVEKWIATTVMETLFDYIKSKALEKTVEKRINKEMTRSKWEMNVDKPCEGIIKEDVAMAMKKKVSAMICFETMKEVVGNHIVNLIDSDEILARAMETILKSKLRQERAVERVEKGQEMEEEMNVIAGNVNGE
jgi:hypothetical protein